MIANKCDLDEDLRTVPDEEGQALAISLGMSFHSISVKEGTSAKEPLRELARTVAEGFEAAVTAAAAAATASIA